MDMEIVAIFVLHCEARRRPRPNRGFDYGPIWFTFGDDSCLLVGVARTGTQREGNI